MNQSNVSAMPQIMRLRDVVSTVGLSKPSIYRLVREGTFPPQVQLSTASVGWLRAEVEAWIAKRVAERDAASLSQLKEAA